MVILGCRSFNIWSLRRAFREFCTGDRRSLRRLSNRDRGVFRISGKVVRSHVHVLSIFANLIRFSLKVGIDRGNESPIHFGICEMLRSLLC